MTPQPGPQLGAFVAGYSAHVLNGLLFKYGHDQYVELERAVQRGTLPDAWRVEFIATWRSIRAAARGWVAEQGAERVAPAVAADGSVSSPPAAAVASSTPEMIDTDQAADLLHVTANRVRQLCRSGMVPGRKVGRTWLVSTDGLRRYRETRDGRF